MLTKACKTCLQESVMSGPLHPNSQWQAADYSHEHTPSCRQCGGSRGAGCGENHPSRTRLNNLSNCRFKKCRQTLSSTMAVICPCSRDLSRGERGCCLFR